MLVISRKAGEAILIGEDIEVVVIETQGSKVKLGINAKSSIRILRKEIVVEVTSENLKAVAKEDAATLDQVGELLKKGNEKWGMYP